MATTEEKTENGLVETIKTVVYALLIAGIFRSLFFQPFWIPSGSMKDTLLIGDFMFVNKMAYGYSKYSCEIPLVRVSFCPFIEGRVMDSDPELGDVVVFKHPQNGTDYVKRLVGMPGDQLQMIDGILHINGQAAPQVPAGEFVETFEPQGRFGNLPTCVTPVGPGGDCVKQRFTETLPNGVEHSVLNARNAGSDNTGVYTVPSDHFFFVGDNRDNSLDSRVATHNRGVGFVHRDYLIGRADRIMFSAAGKSLFFFWTWRSDRFFKAVE